MLLSLAPSVAARNWKCKYVGERPNRREFCHLYRGGMRELRKEMEKAPPTIEPTPWRNDQLTPLLVSPA